MYTIYHVVGVKIGCTTNFERRTSQNRERYGKDIKIEILEVLENCTDQEAGDKEWEWADRLGYARANHYTQRWDSVLSSEELSANGVLAAEAANLGHNSLEERQQHKIGFEHNSWYNGSEKHKRDATKGAAIAIANETTGMQTTSKCPYCGKTGQTAIMGRWHFNNCKYKDVVIMLALCLKYRDDMQVKDS